MNFILHNLTNSIFSHVHRYCFLVVHMRGIYFKLLLCMNIWKPRTIHRMMVFSLEILVMHVNRYLITRFNTLVSQSEKMFNDAYRKSRVLIEHALLVGSIDFIICILKSECRWKGCVKLLVLVPFCTTLPCFSMSQRKMKKSWRKSSH